VKNARHVLAGWYASKRGSVFEGICGALASVRLGQNCKSASGTRSAELPARHGRSDDEQMSVGVHRDSGPLSSVTEADEEGVASVCEVFRRNAVDCSLVQPRLFAGWVLLHDSMSFVSLHANCAKRSRRANILTGAAADAPFGVNDREPAGGWVVGILSRHVDCSGRAMPGAVAAADTVGIDNAQCRYPDRMSDLNR